MPNKPIQWHNGLVTARDASTLREGELQTAIACEYRVGSPHVYKQPGRDRVAQVNITSAAVSAIHKFQYDTGTDKLIAYTSTGGVHEANVATSPTFGTAVLTGLTGTAIPHFTSFNNSWIMCNEEDDNYIREANAVFVDDDADGVNDWTLGNWRKLGMVRPATAPVVSINTTSGVVDRPDNDDAGYTDADNAYDTDTTTFAVGRADSNTIQTIGIWDFKGGATPTHNTALNRTMSIRHEGIVGTGSSTVVRDIDLYRETTTTTGGIAGEQAIQISIDNGVSWILVSRLAMPYTRQTSSFIIPGDTGSGVNLINNVLIRAITNADNLKPGWLKGRVFDIRVDLGNDDTAIDIENDLTYFYAERYTDSDSVVHESAVSESGTAVATDGVYSVTLDLPATPENDFTQEYVIYRSLDEPSGGYPSIWEVGTLNIALGSSWTDVFEESPVNPPISGKLYSTLAVLYPDNTTYYMATNLPPPRSKMSLQYQGSMIYVPVDSHQLYYSLPTTISDVGAEQVPELYYLEFLSPQNDVITSICGVNNGRSLMVYFETYTMMVTYLPQATDPGVFDTRITEYVTKQRGAAGTFCSHEIDMGGGRTLAISVDALGVWATDGVSSLVEWSRDLDWETAMANVTLSDIQLWHNPEMRRVEMHYSDSGNRREYHFYYGRMKQDADGNKAPLITGPHYASQSTLTGYRSKHYNTVDGKWYGWSGDNTSTGDVFLERAVAADDSNAYDGSGTVPFEVACGDYYFGGLGGAIVVNFGYPKFASGTKNVTLTGTFRRDGSSTAATAAKTFAIGSQKKVYWHRYADRHSLNIKDQTDTSMPALVGYELEINDGGIGRDS